jgi:hypothetical protein
MSPIRLPKWVDERFLEHRRRATSVGGIAAVWVAGALFLYRGLAQHAWSVDLFAVIATAAVVKLVLLVRALVKE